MLQDTVDDAGPVEPRHHRKPSGHRRGLEALAFLHPAQVQLHVCPAGVERLEVTGPAPAQVHAEVGLGVEPRLRDERQSNVAETRPLRWAVRSALATGVSGSTVRWLQKGFSRRVI